MSTPTFHINKLIKLFYDRTRTRPVLETDFVMSSVAFRSENRSLLDYPFPLLSVHFLFIPLKSINIPDISVITSDYFSLTPLLMWTTTHSFFLERLFYSEFVSELTKFLGWWTPRPPTHQIRLLLVPVQRYNSCSSHTGTHHSLYPNIVFPEPPSRYRTP